MTSGCVRASGEKGILPKALFGCVYVWLYVHVYAHVIKSAFMCGKKESFQPFSFLSLFLCPLHPSAYNSQSWRRRVWPIQDPTHQRTQRREASVSLPLSLCLPKLCLFPPLTECYCKSFTSYTPYSHISPSSVLVYLIWLGRSEPCICACQYGNVSVKSFGSFLSIASPRDPLGNVVLTPPLFFPLLSFLFLSSQLHYFCFSMLHFCFLPNSIPFPSVFIFLQFQPVEIFCFFLV